MWAVTSSLDLQKDLWKLIVTTTVMEQHILYKSATSNCICKLLYNLYSFICTLSPNCTASNLHYHSSSLSHNCTASFFDNPSTDGWTASSIVFLLSYQGKEIRFAAHAKNMWVVSSSKLCQLYLLHWRRNNWPHPEWVIPLQPTSWGNSFWGGMGKAYLNPIWVRAFCGVVGQANNCPYPGCRSLS